VGTLAFIGWLLLIAALVLMPLDMEGAITLSPLHDKMAIAALVLPIIIAPAFTLSAIKQETAFPDVARTVVQTLISMITITSIFWAARLALEAFQASLKK
jgi:hypothetical protein